MRAIPRYKEPWEASIDDSPIYVAYGVALLLAVHGAYCGKVQETCLRIGLGLDGATGPTGFQDAITPPETTRGIMLNWALTVALFAGVWWQFGIAAVAIAAGVRVVGRVVAGAVLNGSGWKRRLVRKVFGSMVRRQADYEKSGDKLRAEAMGDLLERFKRSPFVAEVAG